MSNKIGIQKQAPVGTPTRVWEHPYSSKGADWASVPQSYRQTTANLIREALECLKKPSQKNFSSYLSTAKQGYELKYF